MKFKDLKKEDTIFLVGSSDFITHEDLVENFGLFKITNIIETLDGKRNHITCFGGEFYGIIPDPTIKKVAYFVALSDSEVSDYQASIRIDEWSEIFTKLISTYHTFLCYQDVSSGLDSMEKKMNKYLEDIKESREINDKAQEEKRG